MLKIFVRWHVILKFVTTAVAYINSIFVSISNDSILAIARSSRRSRFSCSDVNISCLPSTHISDYLELLLPYCIQILLEKGRSLLNYRLVSINNCRISLQFWLHEESVYQVIVETIMP